MIASGEGIATGVNGSGEWADRPIWPVELGRRFTPRTTASVFVKVYSNLDSVQLKVNGVIIGSLTSTNHIFLWPSVALTTGENVILATGTTAATTLTDTVTWTRM